jgi:hypothetical protein
MKVQILLFFGLISRICHMISEKKKTFIALQQSSRFFFLVDVDPRSWEHIDLIILMLRVGVKSKEVVLPCRICFLSMTMTIIDSLIFISK